MRSHCGQALADPDRHILMESGMIAERAQEQLEALRFDDRLGWRIVDHEMGEVGLAGDRTERREFRRGEADEVERARPRIGDIIEHRRFGRSGQAGSLAEMRGFHRAGFYVSGSAQSMAADPRFSRNAFALEKCPQPKKPLCADSGDGCGALSTR